MKAKGRSAGFTFLLYLDLKEKKKTIQINRKNTILISFPQCNVALVKIMTETIELHSNWGNNI